MKRVFIKGDSNENFWLPFKYENLPSFYFGCGRMGHSLKECVVVTKKAKNLSEDDLPYSVALKVEFTILGKMNLKLSNKGKKSMKQFFLF